MTQEYVLNLVRMERQRQGQLEAAGKIPFNCADPNVGNLLKLAVLGEEFGEVCKEVYEAAAFFGQPPADVTAKLRTELVQVAAVAVAWIEGLSTEPAEPNNAEKSEDPMRVAQKLLKDGELQRVPAYLVGQL